MRRVLGSDKWDRVLDPLTLGPRASLDLLCWRGAPRKGPAPVVPSLRGSGKGQAAWAVGISHGGEGAGTPWRLVSDLLG